MRVLFVLGLLFAGCERPAKDARAETGDGEAGAPARLRWVRGYEGDSWSQSANGLWWQLSLLGATPPADGSAVILLEESDDRVLLELDTARLGLGERARGLLDETLIALGESDEARIFGGVDLGRALLGTLYNPWMYYTMTGACPTLEDWKARYLDEEHGMFVVTDSLLVPGEREIRFNLNPSTHDTLAFLAAEGEGALSEGSFHPLEHETLDLLPNGQQRYAVYDEQGAIAPAAIESGAGMPGRCMWCHEGNMQLLSSGNVPVDGYLDPESFLAQLLQAQAVLEETRAAEDSAILWEDPATHDWGERLVETFLAPSPARLGREWGVPSAEVEAKIAALGLPTHISEEYPEQGALLTRADVDEALPELMSWLAARSEADLTLGGSYTPIPVPVSARELDEAALALLPGSELALALDCGDAR